MQAGMKNCGKTTTTVNTEAMNVATQEDVLRKLLLSDESTVSISFENRLRIRPVGVVSKNRIGDPTTTARRRLNKTLEALKDANVSQRLYRQVQTFPVLVRSEVLHDTVASADQRRSDSDSSIHGNVEEGMFLS